MELVSEVIGPLQKEQLKRLIGFAFERNPDYGLPEKHLRYLERLIKARMTQLLKLPSRRRAGKQTGN